MSCWHVCLFYLKCLPSAHANETDQPVKKVLTIEFMSSEESEEDIDGISIQLLQLNLYPGEQQRLTVQGKNSTEQAANSTTCGTPLLCGAKPSSLAENFFGFV